MKHSSVEKSADAEAMMRVMTEMTQGEWLVLSRIAVHLINADLMLVALIMN